MAAMKTALVLAVASLLLSGAAAQAAPRPLANLLNPAPRQSAPPPTITAITPGNSAVTIDFKPPTLPAGQTVGQYRVACNPTRLSTDATSFETVVMAPKAPKPNQIEAVGLVNGISYVCTITGVVNNPSAPLGQRLFATAASNPTPSFVTSPTAGDITIPVPSVAAQQGPIGSPVAEEIAASPVAEAIAASPAAEAIAASPAAKEITTTVAPLAGSPVAERVAEVAAASPAAEGATAGVFPQEGTTAAAAAPAAEAATAEAPAPAKTAAEEVAAAAAPAAEAVKDAVKTGAEAVKTGAEAVKAAVSGAESATSVVALALAAFAAVLVL